LHWLSAAQVVGQLALLPEHAYAPQVPGLLAGRTVQAPLFVAPRLFAQTSHPPPQAELQQKLSTQLPNRHCPLVEHAAPFVSCARQDPPPQYVPAGHWSWLEQLLGQLAL
jgi:hypothetical protein